jgi:hypothetical protein
MKPRGASLLLTAHRIKVKRAVFNEIGTSGEDTQPPSLPERPPPAIRNESMRVGGGHRSHGYAASCVRRQRL